MISAGKLDRRIVIQVKTETRDSHGGVASAWATLAIVWAQYLSGGGNERFASAQVYAETQARFRLRYRRDVTVENRVIFNDKEWDVLAVVGLGRREGLELKVKARA